MSDKGNIPLKLGDYFIITSGYCANGGLVSKTREALLFLTDCGNVYRPASNAEIEKYQKNHPILKSLSPS